MARTTWQVASRRRRKRVLKLAKGYYAGRRTHIKTAKETVMRGKAYATRDRKNRKREYRALWIVRLNAAARARGLKYSELINALRKAKVGINRQQLSELAIHDAGAFDELVSTATGTATTAPPKKPAKKVATAAA